MWDVTSMGVRGLAPWSWSNFEITGCQISYWKHFRLKMWDFTTKGVRGLAPEAEAFLKIISCWDFTSIGVIGFAPWSWSILKSTSCQISWRILKSWSIFKITSHHSLPCASFFFPSLHFSRCWGGFQGITLLKTFPSTFENIFFPSLRIFFLPLSLFFLPLSPFFFPSPHLLRCWGRFSTHNTVENLPQHLWKYFLPLPAHLFSSLPLIF